MAAHLRYWTVFIFFLKLRCNHICVFVTEPQQVWEEMVSACWCGLLAALSLLLDAR